MGEVLDRLERLAKDDVAVPEFLKLLEDRSSYELAWDLEDATIARARCHEDRGEFLEAMTVLRQDVFYRLATTEREDGLNDAAGILERIRGYGIEREMKKHDALVIIRFMRTHLGREIRRTWDGVWRSCWGGGPGSIVEAVAKAAAAVR